MCARMRCLRPGGIAVGREACTRSDLRLFVTYSQISGVLGVRLLLDGGYLLLKYWVTSSKRRLSMSGNSPRFFPDMRLGTDCGPAVHPVRAVDKSCACHELCAAHVSIASRAHRRAAE